MTYSNSHLRGTTVMSLTRYTTGQVQTTIVESATSSPLAILKLKTEKTKNVISVLVKNKQIMIIMEMQKLQDNYTKINIWRNHWRIQKATNKLNIDELCTQIKP